MLAHPGGDKANRICLLAPPPSCRVPVSVMAAVVVWCRPVSMKFSGSCKLLLTLLLVLLTAHCGRCEEYHEKKCPELMNMTATFQLLCFKQQDFYIKGQSENGSINITFHNNSKEAHTHPEINIILGREEKQLVISRLNVTMLENEKHAEESMVVRLGSRIWIVKGVFEAMTVTSSTGVGWSLQPDPGHLSCPNLPTQPHQPSGAGQMIQVRCEPSCAPPPPQLPPQQTTHAPVTIALLAVFVTLFVLSTVLFLFHMLSQSKQSRVKNLCRANCHKQASPPSPMQPRAAMTDETVASSTVSQQSSRMSHNPMANSMPVPVQAPPVPPLVSITEKRHSLPRTTSPTSPLAASQDQTTPEQNTQKTCDDDSSEEHEYDYVDLNAYKTQECKFTFNTPGNASGKPDLTRHDSQNSLYIPFEARKTAAGATVNTQ